MKKPVRAPKLRKVIADALRHIPNGGLRRSQIVTELMMNNVDNINAEGPDLVEIALVRIINQVVSRRSNTSSEVERDLYDQYRLSPMIAIGPVGQDKTIKRMENATFEELSKYAEEHIIPSSGATKQALEIKRLVDTAEAAGAKPENTVGDWWKTQSPKKA
jgi:hypothetical protein